MVPAKFSLSDAQVDFVNQYEVLGFPDKSSVVRAAIDQFQAQCQERRLQESADLYAEIYAEDEELQRLADITTEDWPE